VGRGPRQIQRDGTRNQLLNEFFWPNYRNGVYVVAYGKCWFELKGVISGHKVRTPLLNMTKEEEDWLRTRIQMLEAGIAPADKPDLEPYPLQQGGDATAGRIGI
jgi:hypothetical protein